MTMPVEVVLRRLAADVGAGEADAHAVGGRRAVDDPRSRRTSLLRVARALLERGLVHGPARSGTSARRAARPGRPSPRGRGGRGPGRRGRSRPRPRSRAGRGCGASASRTSPGAFPSAGRTRRRPPPWSRWAGSASRGWMPGPEDTGGRVSRRQALSMQMCDGSTTRKVLTTRTQPKGRKRNILEANATPSARTVGDCRIWVSEERRRSPTCTID